jgi:hypothetical protein
MAPGSVRCSGELAPVGAELEGHHNAGHDTEPERDGKDSQPEVEQPTIDGLLEHQGARFEKGEPGRKPDRERGKDDVERHREGELDAREQQGAGVHGRGSSLA